MTFAELQRLKAESSDNWGWVFAPENIIDDYKCTVTGCILPTIFEGYPHTGFWYSICAIHGWFLGMTACFDEPEWKDGPITGA